MRLFLSALTLMNVLSVAINLVSPGFCQSVVVTPRVKEPPQLERVQSIPLPADHEGLAISDDGTTLATQQHEGGQCFVQIWSALTGKMKRRWLVRDAEELTLGFSPRGGKLVVAMSLPYDERKEEIPTRVQLFDVATGKLLVTLPKSAIEDIDLREVTFSPNEQLLVLNDTVWSVKTGRRLWKARPGYVWPDFDFSPDGRMIATSQSAGYYEADGRVFLRNARTGKLIKTLRGAGGADGPVLFSPDGKQLAATGKPPGWTPPAGDFGDSGYPINFAVKVWDVRTGKCVRVIEGNSEDHAPLCFLSNSKLLVEHGHSLNIWDTQTNKLLGTWGEPQGDVSVIGNASSPSGKRLMAVTDTTIDIYAIPSV